MNTSDGVFKSAIGHDGMDPGSATILSRSFPGASTLEGIFDEVVGIRAGVDLQPKSHERFWMWLADHVSIPWSPSPQIGSDKLQCEPLTITIKIYLCCLLVSSDKDLHETLVQSEYVEGWNSFDSFVGLG